MARTNFKYEKRQKELAKQKKAEEKRQRKLERRSAAAEETGYETPADAEANEPADSIQPSA